MQNIHLRKLIKGVYLAIIFNPWVSSYFLLQFLQKPVHALVYLARSLLQLPRLRRRRVRLLVMLMMLMLMLGRTVDLTVHVVLASM